MQFLEGENWVRAAIAALSDDPDQTQALPPVFEVESGADEPATDSLVVPIAFAIQELPEDSEVDDDDDTIPEEDKHRETALAKAAVEDLTDIVHDGETIDAPLLSRMSRAIRAIWSRELVAYILSNYVSEPLGWEPEDYAMAPIRKRIALVLSTSDLLTKGAIGTMLDRILNNQESSRKQISSREDASNPSYFHRLCDAIHLHLMYLSFVLVLKANAEARPVADATIANLPLRTAPKKPDARKVALNQAYEAARKTWADREEGSDDMDFVFEVLDEVGNILGVIVQAYRAALLKGRKG
jgi:hypothetical protein